MKANVGGRRQRRRRFSGVRKAVARLSFRKRMSEKNIIARINKLFPGMGGKDPYWNFVRKGHSKLAGVGTKRLVFRMGAFLDPKTGETAHLILKVYRFSDAEMLKAKKRALRKGEAIDSVKDRYENQFSIEPRGHRLNEEIDTFERAASLGVPVPSHIALVRVKGFKVLTMEDLSQRGRFEVAEFHNFDFNRVSNGNEIRVQFEDYFQRLKGAGVKVNRLGQHIRTGKRRGAPAEELTGETAVREETERSFFVVINPKTRKGEIVLGDADQIKF